MNDESKMLVKAVRPFEGVEGYKDERSEPFAVSRGRYADLKANGLVETAAGDVSGAPVIVEGEAQKNAPAVENKMIDEPSNKSTRPSRQKTEG